MENVRQCAFALLGAMRIGAVTVPLPTAMPENSLRTIAEHAGCKLLFADDERSLQELMSRELPRMGHEVTVCPDGRTKGRVGFQYRSADLHVRHNRRPKSVELTDNINPEIRGVLKGLT
jgi:acyl-coenzyme A synthetase/AMP-(fatty) acid ligase